MNKPNFWNSYEIDCISRDFSYKDYIRIHSEFKLSHALLHETSYVKLNEIFNDELKYHENDKPNTDT